MSIRKMSLQQFLLNSILLLALYVPAAYAADNNSKQMLPLEDLQVFSEVFNLIRENYVEEISDSTLFENAINGMLDKLDQHSTYLDAEHLNELVDKTRGSFYGIGIEIKKEDVLLSIVSVMPDSPAAKANITAGDIILTINGTPTDKLSLSQASHLLKGDDNTKLRLTILSPDAESSVAVTLIRKKINLANVDAKLLEPEYLYIKISSFQENTARKLRDILFPYLDKPMLRGIIIDLRNNPGGLLNAAVDVCDLFLREGLIVYTQGRSKSSRQEFWATDDDISKNVNLAILINQNSASASEIVAGALQDLKRAIIVGVTSFGKGSVQTVIPITGSRAIKLTTSLYYTPSGKTIDVHGIKPDIVVEKDDVNKKEDTQLIAALNALKGSHLQQEKEAAKFLEQVE